MATAQEVVTVDPTNDGLWRRLVSTRPSTVFHAPGWMRVLAKTYGFEVAGRVLVDPAGDPVAGFAYARIDDFVESRITSMPFTDFCDPIVDDAGQWRLLVDGVVAGRLPIDLRCIDADAPVDDDRFTEVHRALWHGVDLNRDVDTIWADLDSGARRAIRRARNSGVMVRTARDIDDLRAFFELHLGVRRRKYGLLAQPFSFFESIWHEFIDVGAGFLLLAYHEGAVIGGVLFLQWQDTLYYKFNASDPALLSVRPNDLLLWTGIVDGAQRGVRLLDFGLSEPDQEGLVRYKRKYATREKVVRFLRYRPEPAGSRVHHSRALLQQLTALLVAPSVPDDVAERAGELLYRHFT